MNVTVTMFRRLLALALVGALAATAVALLTGGSPSSAADPAPAGQSPDPSASSQSPAELEEAFAADFALLRTPGGADIPATARLDDPGLRIDESRRLTPPPSRVLARVSTSGDADPQDPDAIAWVIPKDDGSQCLIAYLTDVQQFGTGCAYPADAVAGRFVLTLSRTGEDAGIYGLMPDGVDSVTVDLADGSSAELPVVDNAYMALFDRPTEAVRWTDAGGVEQTVNIGSGG
jgi:hypothetical protein